MYKITIVLKKIYWIICKKIGFSITFRDERKSVHSKKLKKFNTVTGIYFLPKFAYQDVIRREIIKNRIFDKDVFDLSKKFIKPNSVVIDAGANYGQMSILFSKLYKNVNVYSFEASKYIYDILCKNVKENSKNIIPVNCILSDKNSKKFIEHPKITSVGTYGALNLQILKNSQTKDGYEVFEKKIDDYKFNKKISFMKIDVQGWDLKVLKGSVNTINIHRMPIIFEYEKQFENQMNINFSDYINFFERINYKFMTTFNSNFLVVPSEQKKLK